MSTEATEKELQGFFGLSDGNYQILCDDATEYLRNKGLLTDENGKNSPQAISEENTRIGRLVLRVRFSDVMERLPGSRLEQGYYLRTFILRRKRDAATPEGLLCVS